jgi:hypothetical protein
VAIMIIILIALFGGCVEAFLNPYMFVLSGENCLCRTTYSFFTYIFLILSSIVVTTDIGNL